MGRKRVLKRKSTQMKMLYCQNCGLPYGFRSRTIEGLYTPEGDKLRKKFRKMKHCDCKNRIEED